MGKCAYGRVCVCACDRADLPMVKFVIPNPFGPYEAQTFQRAVMTRWRPRPWAFTPSGIS